ncbi:hypothetical protein [Clostridium yunnanense]|uniref:hypothetical protein n=1 Tax=Clostridium yunnanense TaxID=2800325 RepID=UPI001905F5D8|nr:hypothetical protein [Clostridium yunnanense]
MPKEKGFFSYDGWDKDIQSLLPGLGQDGWELVNVVAVCSSWDNSGATTEEKWIFKRPKS